MATLVLVPGFWLGGWCWRDVAAPLRAAGHIVYTPSLTGLGERVHLATPETDLETHIADIVNLLVFEELTDVILIGHSYAGSNVTIGVADRVPERLARLVYVDTGPLPGGMAQADFGGPEQRAHNERVVAEQGDGWRLPLPPLAEFGPPPIIAGLGAVEWRTMRERAVPQPWRTATTPNRLNNPAREAIPALGILCTFTEEAVREMVASGNPVFTALGGPQWSFAELPAGHWPMFSEPAKLAALLGAAAAAGERWRHSCGISGRVGLEPPVNGVGATAMPRPLPRYPALRGSASRPNLRGSGGTVPFGTLCSGEAGVQEGPSWRHNRRRTRGRMPICWRCRTMGSATRSSRGCATSCPPPTPIMPRSSRI